MTENAREKILKRLKEAHEREPAPRPPMPSLNEALWDREEMISGFTAEVIAQTGVVHRVADLPAAICKLTEIVKEEQISKIMTSADDIVALLDLATWGEQNDIEVMTPRVFEDRNSFKQAVFCEAEAGITGADYGIAESGTLVLAHGKDQPRLVSLAPITHIAILPIDRLRPVYEDAIAGLFDEDGRKTPSQISFITGPSMTGDIQGVPFKGMHGPKRLFVILIDEPGA